LEALLIAGRWLTSVEAIERFAAAQQPASSMEAIASKTDPPPAPRHVIRAQATDTELRDLGL
jgi:hypothetical protein